MEKLQKSNGPLASIAFDSKETQGRRYFETEQSPYHEFKDPFQIDIERIRNGVFFPRLEDKTQAFFVNYHKNVKNRRTHTEEVVKIASYISSALGLNVSLTKAIALGHDLGHVALGHLGEEIISKLASQKISHATMGVIMAQELERDGKGLNLSHEVLEGILEHSSANGDCRIPDRSSAESSVVVIADKIAATFSDLSDALKIGYLKKENIPWEILWFLGKNQKERRANTVDALIRESASAGKICFCFSQEAVYFSALKKWMYANIYLDARNKESWRKEEKAFYQAFKIFCENPSFKEMDPIFLLIILSDGEINQIIAKQEMILYDKKCEFTRIALSLKHINWGVDVLCPNL